jgi:hypothetical protein
LSGKVDKEMRINGVNKKWGNDGSIIIGEYKNDIFTEG